ncbi:universal stress protein [Kitasatospora sp. DSM 101779]|uniref:universal stress protein n=1 Tax=Kitasatospora sp. DSM 101779 TaxID=2853165 RepID=UPI0021D879F4|nr:universal stress protein [Kitasatospora sp. DSM 101779]MCU7826421.1 universal stress protein [Kitasatospora sp. DSM 101779]
MTEQDATRRRIVAGVDGSPSSVDALRWAVGQAHAVGAVVEAVIAWQDSVSPGWTGAADAEGFAAGIARKILDVAIAEVSDPDRPVWIGARVVEGGAAPVLLDAARGADLLVVGSRGRGGFTGALLGSVSQHCVQHAPCPVVVVRHREN